MVFHETGHAKTIGFPAQDYTVPLMLGSTILGRSHLLKLWFQNKWQCHLVSSRDSLVVLQLSASPPDLRLYIFLELLQRWWNETSPWWKVEIAAAFSACRLLAERNHYQISTVSVLQDHVLSNYVLALPQIRFDVEKYRSSSPTHTTSILVMMPKILHCAQTLAQLASTVFIAQGSSSVLRVKRKGTVSEPQKETVLADCDDFRISIRTLTVFVSFGPCSLKSIGVFIPCLFGPGYIWTCQSKAAMAA